jgi:hypothetical protein
MPAPDNSDAIIITTIAITDTGFATATRLFCTDSNANSKGHNHHA